jgi:protein-tyrosine-phosphatase
MNVVFICVANSGRSVMSASLFNQIAAGRHHATSAGSEPGDAVHPVVLQALKAIGIDASDHVPPKIDMDEMNAADAVVSTCGEEACPVTPPNVRRMYWNLPDGKNLPRAEAHGDRGAPIVRHDEAVHRPRRRRVPRRSRGTRAAARRTQRV